jgi:hypothetical protein
LIWAVIFYFGNRRHSAYEFDLNSKMFANYKKIGIEKGFFIRPRAEYCFNLETCLAQP